MNAWLRRLYIIYILFFFIEIRTIFISFLRDRCIRKETFKVSLGLLMENKLFFRRENINIFVYFEVFQFQKCI